jgi:ABC-type uncharacterized transport system permease subunit
MLLIAATTVAAATPIMLASLGEALTEHSGVQNLGIEGLMLIGALAAFWARRLGRGWSLRSLPPEPPASCMPA